MILRALAALTLSSTFVLGLAACGDDKDPGTTLTNPTNNPSTTPGETSADTTADPEPTGSSSEGGAEEGVTSSTSTTGEPVTTTTNVDTTVTETAVTSETTVDPSNTDTGPGETTVDPSNTDTGPGETTVVDPSDTETGGGGGLYGPCAQANPPCPDGQQCLSITGLEGEFCSPACEGMGMMKTCPMPEAGMGQCVLTTEDSPDVPVQCAVICDPADPDTCPQGATCKPIQGVGVCTYP